MGNRIDGISAFRIRMPLTRPYHLSLVTLDYFDSILVRIQADGKEGFGETTDIPGYFHETPEDAWDFIERWGPKLLNKDPESIFQEKQMVEDGASRPRTVDRPVTPLRVVLLKSGDRRVKETVFFWIVTSQDGAGPEGDDSEFARRFKKRQFSAAIAV